jgi:hypothetical protein
MGTGHGQGLGHGTGGARGNGPGLHQGNQGNPERREAGWESAGGLRRFRKVKV